MRIRIKIKFFYVLSVKIHSRIYYLMNSLVPEIKNEICRIIWADFQQSCFQNSAQENLQHPVNPYISPLKRSFIM